MRRKGIKFSYDRDVDAAYMTLSRGKIAESEEAPPGVVADFDAAGDVLGVEILRFTRRFASQHGTGKPDVRNKPLRKSA
jgi:uncharacterized protein YuzE